HSGGEDLQFPHHENEIAQSETLADKPFANYWLHNGMITVNNQKMAKSEGNFFTIKDISDEYSLEALRFFLLSAHYRSPINFSRDAMEQTVNGLNRLYNGKNNLEYLINKTRSRELDEEDEKSLEKINKYKEEFIKSMEDDLNTADGIASIFELVKFANTNLNERSNKKVIIHAQNTLTELSNILGILSKTEEILEEEILKLIEERSEARKNKDFQLADEIRDSLQEQGIILEDTQDGVKWKRV